MEPSCTSPRAHSIKNKDQTLPPETRLKYLIRDPTITPLLRVEPDPTVTTVRSSKTVSNSDCRLTQYSGPFREFKTVTTSTILTGTGETGELTEQSLTVTGLGRGLTIISTERSAWPRRGPARRIVRSPSGGTSTGRGRPSRQMGL